MQLSGRHRPRRQAQSSDMGGQLLPIHLYAAYPDVMLKNVPCDGIAAEHEHATDNHAYRHWHASFRDVTPQD